MKSNTNSVGEAIIEELDRCREVHREYIQIGPVGMIGAALIKISIQNAERALSEGNIIEILKAYEDLKSIKW